MPFVDYRDRASVLVWVVLIGLTAQRLLSLPSVALSGNLFGSPITLTLTVNTLLGVLLAGMVASGAEAVVRSHPRSVAGEISRHWVFWALPIALVLVALLMLPLAPSRLYWLVGLVLTGIVLGLSLAGIYYTVDPYERGYRRARLGMNAMTYGVALVLFLSVYQSRVRSLLSATEILFVSGLLGLELLRGSERPISRVTLYAGISGLILGQATWALNYWRLDSLSGGLILLLLFYDVIGLAQNALHGRLNRRTLLEYGLISIAALALIWRTAPR